MNWEATGAIGEIIGAAAVVISLIYLASQIRISNRASRQAAEQNLLDNQRQWLGRIADSDSLSTIWMRGAKDDPDLTEGEWIRYGTLCHEVTLGWERSFLLEQDGGVSSAVVERDKRMRRIVIGSPGYRKWFMARKSALTAEFAEQIESELTAAEPYSVAYAGDRSVENET
ncbi:MAG: hypothetical protein R3E64_09565 [Halioglobus sp.]